MKPSAEISSQREIDAAAARWVARRDVGLSGVEEAELDRWIAADARHETAFRFYHATWSALAKPAGSGAAATFEREIATLARGRRRKRIVALGGALAALLAIRIATLDRSMVTTEATLPSAVVVKPARQILPDGTVVELKGNARIVVDFISELRRVKLTPGEAYFSVAKDPHRPFIVSAGGVEVRAVGTEFSVQLAAGAVDVLVTDGTVAVAKAGTAANASAVPDSPVLATVQAGSRVTVDLAAPAPKVAVTPVLPAETGEQLIWRRPRVEFTRASLAEAVALLNQHASANAPRLVITDPALAATCVTGVFRADNTDAFVLLLEGAFGVKAEHSGQTIVLRRASPETAPE